MSVCLCNGFGNSKLDIKSVLYVVRSVPIPLFKGDVSFWIVQDSIKHLLDVQLHVCTTFVWVHSIEYNRGPVV